MKNDIKIQPTYWANVSGGKDSLYMLKLILEHPERYPLNGVIHFELEIDYPFIKNVIDYMQFECEKRGIKFVRIKPRHSWYALYDKNGFPTRKNRWCNSQYKLDALKQLENYMKTQNRYVVSYIGYCADEKQRIEKHKNKKPNDIYPLAEFNIIEADILKWAKNVAIFDDFYKVNTRCGCMYCPLASYTNLAYLAYKYPHKFDELMNMCYETEFNVGKILGRQFSIWQSNPKYNTPYVYNQIMRKYLPKVKQIIEGGE